MLEIPSLNTNCLSRLIVGGLIIGLLSLFAGSALAQDDFTLRLENGAVWLEADNADLRQVLQQLAQDSGFKLWISDKLEARPVNARIENKSVTQTLNLLLDDIAHALVRDGDARVTGLYVLPTGEDQASTDLPSPGSNEERIEAIRNALKTSPLSEMTQETLANQLGTISLPQSSQEAPMPLPEQSEALRELSEKLKQIGASDPEQLPALLEQLKADTDQ